MKNLILCLSIPLLFGCGEPNANSQDHLGVNWEGLNLEEFSLAFGDKILFESEGNSIPGIIVDFSEDEGGKWYGICFLRGEDLFGTQVPAGFTGDVCLDLLDVCYLEEQGLKNYKVLGSIELDEKKITVGVRGGALDFADLTERYKAGIAQRKKPQTPCREDLFDLDRVLECYLPTHSFKK